MMLERYNQMSFGIVYFDEEYILAIADRRKTYLFSNHQSSYKESIIGYNPDLFDRHEANYQKIYYTPNKIGIMCFGMVDYILDGTEISLRDIVINCTANTINEVAQRLSDIFSSCIINNESYVSYIVFGFENGIVKGKEVTIVSDRRAIYADLDAPYFYCDGAKWTQNALMMLNKYEKLPPDKAINKVKDVMSAITLLDKHMRDYNTIGDGYDLLLITSDGVKWLN